MLTVVLVMNLFPAGVLLAAVIKAIVETPREEMEWTKAGSVLLFLLVCVFSSITAIYVQNTK